jgi:hypothetical protein
MNSAALYSVNDGNSGTLKLEVGQIYTLALQYTTGKQSKYNQNEMYFTLASGQLLVVPSVVGIAIDRLNLEVGEEFTLGKLRGGNWHGPRRVEREEARPQQPARPSAPPPNVRVSSKETESYHPNAAPPPQMMNGSGETAAQILAGHYQAAVEIALAGVEACRARGLMVAPTFEDVRCIATTLFIQGSRQ